jgi:hypothetical protein
MELTQLLLNNLEDQQLISVLSLLEQLGDNTDRCVYFHIQTLGYLARLRDQ